MKKSFYFIAVAAALLASSCAKEIAPSAVREGNTTLSFTNSMVKSELDTDGTTVKWLSTDKISVFDSKSANNEFSALSVSGASATFTGDAEASSTYYALYPYAAGASISGSVISTTLPAEQVLKAGSFGDGLNIAVAKCSDIAAGSTFANVTSLLKFVIPAELKDIVKIEISAAETLAGDFTVDLSGETPVVAKGSGSKKITLTAEGGAKIAAGTYYVSLLPGDLSGLTVTLTTFGGETASFAKDVAVTLNRGKVRSIGTVKWDYKALYDAGQTIYICGQAYSKAVNGDSKEIVATAANTDIPKNNTIGWAAMNSGVIFLSEEGEGSCFGNAQLRTVDTDKNVAFIGRYKGAPVTFKRNGNTFSIKGGILSFKNVIINKADGNNIFGLSANSVGLYFDGCTIIDVGGGQMFYANGTTGGVQNIAIENCDFALNIPSGTAGLFYNAGNNANMAQYPNISIKNNVVYNAAYVRYTFFQFGGTAQTGTAGGETATVSNNTLYNVCSGYNGLVYHNHFDTFTAEKNLFHMNTTGFGFYLFRVLGDAVTVNASDNYSFGLYSSSWVIKYGAGTDASNLITRVYPNSTDPLPGLTSVAGDWTPIAKYAAYGAKR